MSNVYEIDFPDFHRLTLTLLKVFHAKYKPKIIQYRDLNHFDNASYRVDLLQDLSHQNFPHGKFENFKYVSSKVFNIHTQIKQKRVRCKPLCL